MKIHGKRWMILLVVALLLAACGGQEAQPTEAPTEAPEPTEAPPPEATSTEEPEPTEEMEVTNAVTVSDQTLGADGTVTIDNVTADVKGWMVIHADDGGAPGPVIGHAAVSAGENSDVMVEVDASQVTETLYAMLHVDAGTEGEYEFPGDDGPARDAEGNVVTPPFMVSLPNSLTVEDQTIEDGTVTIAGISAAVPSWMVIHADDGGPGPVIGHAPVEQGQNNDVVVEIDTSQATETLYAMLHVDAGVEGEYEFPGDDGPAMDAEGNVVTPPFMVTFPNSVTVEDQAISEEGTVTIASISSAMPGWLVVHADDEGGPGPVIGHAAVEQGLNSDVVVEIDTAAATETLYARLHVDAGTEGEYEFPGDDGPAMDAEGNVVTPPFTATSE